MKSIVLPGCLRDDTILAPGHRQSLWGFWAVAIPHNLRQSADALDCHRTTEPMRKGILRRQQGYPGTP